MIFNRAVTCSSLQLASLEHGIFRAGSGRRKGTVHCGPPPTAALALAVPPALSHVFCAERRKKQLLCIGLPAVPVVQPAAQLGNAVSFQRS